MENKNGIIAFSIIFLIIGIFVGWLICSSKSAEVSIPSGMHQMPDGSMMRNGSMDMGEMMENMMMGLKGKTGDGFDKAFLSEMIMHHEGAVLMAEAVLKASNRPELIKLANDIISAQTKEIEMMQGWQKSWFGQ